MSEGTPASPSKNAKGATEREGKAEGRLGLLNRPALLDKHNFCLSARKGETSEIDLRDFCLVGLERRSRSERWNVFGTVRVRNMAWLNKSNSTNRSLECMQLFCGTFRLTVS